MLSANPGLRQPELKTILEDTAVDLGAPGYDIYFGHGRVDAVEAVRGALAARMDVTPPLVAITAPLDEETVRGLVPVEVSAIDDVGVTQVDLYVNCELYATEDVPPYSFIWDSTQVTNGAAALSSHAYDAQGNEGISETVSVTVDNSPACSDGLDNDDDGFVDDPDDPGCVDASDLSEQDPTLPCDDGADNDGDGRIDFDPVTFVDPGDQYTLPAGSGDPGCKNPSWSTESPACQDGVNNDPGHDPDPGLIDFDGGQSIWGACTGEPGGCPAKVSDPEKDGVANPDPECVGKPWRHLEKPYPCGLGAELALFLPPLIWHWRTRRS
jgi:hypothetical protein